MTRRDPKAAWARAVQRYGLDPVDGDKEAMALLHQPAHEQQSVAQNIAGLDRIRDACPSFFDNHDYGWAFDESVYRRGIEANFQARVLQQLAMLHQSPHRPEGLPYDNVAVRYTFEASTDPCTPLHLPFDGWHFIVTPFSFQEFVLLFTRAVIDEAGVKSDWEGFRSFRGFRRATSPFLKQAILRTLTTDAFHASFEGDNPVDAVKQQSVWFADAAERGAVPPEVEVPLTYSLIDYALAHELGHVLHQHEGLAREPDIRLEKEQDADVMGFALFNTSWGWRDEVINDAPLNPGARILLGPLLFHAFIDWHLTLRKGVSVRVGKQAGTTISVDIKEAEARAIIASKQLAAYAEQIIARGATFNADDRDLLKGVIAATSAFQARIKDAVHGIPDEDLEIATKIGQSPF